MNHRYLDFIGEVLPEFDANRLSIFQKKEGIAQKKDFASECCHNAYLHALYYQSWPIGDYTGRSKKPSDNKRHRFVDFISELHEQKAYKIETLFVAISIFDRYILADNHKQSNLGCVAIVSLLIAAKLEQPVVPSFELILDLVPTCQLTVKDLIS